MAERIERVNEVADNDGTTTRTTRVVESDTVAESGGAATQSLVTRVVWFIAGVIITLLAIRFVLVLLGANANSGFADFIYTASRPFVAPFFNLFSYDLSYGVSRFEIFTLVAMGIYALIAGGIAQLININRPQQRV